MRIPRRGLLRLAVLTPVVPAVVALSAAGARAATAPTAYPVPAASTSTLVDDGVHVLWTLVGGASPGVQVTEVPSGATRFVALPGPVRQAVVDPVLHQVFVAVGTSTVAVPATGATRTLPVDGSGGLAVDAPQHRLYALDGAVTLADTRSGAVLATANPEATLLAVDPVGHRLVTATSTVVTVLDGGTLATTSTALVGDDYDPTRAIAVDGPAGKVLAVSDGGRFGNQVRTLDLTTGAQTTATLPGGSASDPGASSLVLDTVAHRLSYLEQGLAEVVRYDETAGTLTAVALPAGAAPTSTALDPSTGAVYAVRPDAVDVVAGDGSVSRLAQTGALAAAVAPSRAEVYLTTPGSVRVVATGSGTATPTPPPPAPPVRATGPIAGAAWEDQNGNRHFDTGIDTPLGGIRVTAQSVVSELCPRLYAPVTTTTDATGYYYFAADRLVDGCDYVLTSGAPTVTGVAVYVAPQGALAASVLVPTVTVPAGARSTFYDVGFSGDTRTVQGNVWFDTLATGVFDRRLDPPVRGARVTVAPTGGCSGRAAQLVTTSASGRWSATVPYACDLDVRIERRSLPFFQRVTYASDGTRNLTDHLGASETRSVDVGYTALP